MFKTNEKEYKYLVTEEQFQTLLSKCYTKFPFVKHELQVNYYYDTERNVLNKTKTTVRIRQNRNDMKLQIKKHMECSGGLHMSNESSEKINVLPDALNIPGISNDLYLKGVLVTERTAFAFGKNSIICFDNNLFLGIYDCEIEIEVDIIDKTLASMVIQDLGLTQKKIASKSERFFERLEAMNCE